jgi:hypothetical protein
MPARIGTLARTGAADRNCTCDLPVDSLTHLCRPGTGKGSRWELPDALLTGLLRPTRWPPPRPRGTKRRAIACRSSERRPVGRMGIEPTSAGSRPALVGQTSNVRVRGAALARRARRAGAAPRSLSSRTGEPARAVGMAGIEPTRSSPQMRRPAIGHHPESVSEMSRYREQGSNLHVRLQRPPPFQLGHPGVLAARRLFCCAPR